MMLALVATTVAGCATWEPLDEDPRAFIAREHPSSVVVRSVGREAVRVRDPVIDDNDRVAGERWGTRGVRVTFRPNEIEEVLVRDVHPGRTMIFLVPVSIAFFAVAWYSAGGS